MTALSYRYPNATRLGPAMKLVALPVAIVIAVLLDGVIAAVAHADGVTGFAPLTPGPYISLTVVGMLLATAGWALLRRLVPRSARLMRWLVPTVLTLSFVPDIALLFGDRSQTHASGGAVVALMAMHVAVAVVTVGTLRRLLPLR